MDPRDRARSDAWNAQHDASSARREAKKGQMSEETAQKLRDIYRNMHAGARVAEQFCFLVEALLEDQGYEI